MVTEVDSAFEWLDTAVAGRLLICRPLQDVASHAFTTRDLRFRGATAEHDRAALGSWLGIPDADLVSVTQVHGCRVITADAMNQVGRAEADAVVTCTASQGVAVQVADCVPLLIADRRRRAVAAVHAGWRGTADHIAVAAVDHFRALGIGPEDLTIAVGPSIGACCYQVDAPVRAAFLQRHAESAAWFAADGPSHWRLDLWRANRDQLTKAGVPAWAIYTAGLCTMHHASRFWSYRREGAGSGRMVAAIVLRDRDRH